MLVDEIKKRIASAMKEKRDLEKEILRVALGEIQTIEARGQTTMGDEQALQVVRKLVKSNEETLSVTQDPAKRRQLAEETEILRTLLPQSLSVEQIVAALAPVQTEIRSAKADGPATGIAMKHLKSAGQTAEGKDVGAAVARIRSQ